MIFHGRECQLNQVVVGGIGREIFVRNGDVDGVEDSDTDTDRRREQPKPQRLRHRWWLRARKPKLI